ncbi:MAG: IS200/IS605 family transposase [Candidatus Kapabacteria bacterium]|nr:IS200/IS605 family transposase [Candidatus Kapabacteria bacterium]
MGQSLVKNYIHIVFSTKNRSPYIQPNVETELHKFLSEICNKLQCTVIKVGGFTDHIHILCLLSKNIALSKLVGELKSRSSMWMKTKDATLEHFYWQDGYGAFSVNPTHIDAVITYINNQHEHHKNNSFEEEYKAFLHKYSIDYNEQYLWD